MAKHNKQKVFVPGCDPCGCWNLKDGGVTIGIWSMIYCAVQFSIFGWQTYAIYWERVKVALIRSPNHGALDPFSARFNAYWYEMFSESEEERFFLGVFIIQILNLIVDFFLLGASIALIIGIHLSSRHLVWPWFPCMATSILCTLTYCIIWWIFKAQSYWVVLTIVETFSVVINSYCMWCIALQYRLIKKGTVGEYLEKQADKLPKKNVLVYDSSAGGGGLTKSQIMEQEHRDKAPLKQQEFGQLNQAYLQSPIVVTQPTFYNAQNLRQQTSFAQPQQALTTKVDYIPQQQPLQACQVYYGPNGEQYIIAQPAQQNYSSPLVAHSWQQQPLVTTAAPPGYEMAQMDISNAVVPEFDYTRNWLQNVEHPPPQPYVLPLRQEFVEKSLMPMTATALQTSHNNENNRTMITETSQETSVSKPRRHRRKSRSESSMDRESRRSRGFSRHSRSSRRHRRSNSRSSSGSSTESYTTYGGRSAVTSASQVTVTSHRSPRSTRSTKSSGGESKSTSKHQRCDDDHRKRHKSEQRSRSKSKRDQSRCSETDTSAGTTTLITSSSDVRSQHSSRTSSSQQPSERDRDEQLQRSERKKHRHRENENDKKQTPRHVKQRDRLRTAETKTETGTKSEPRSYTTEHTFQAASTTTSSDYNESSAEQPPRHMLPTANQERRLPYSTKPIQISTAVAQQVPSTANRVTATTDGGAGAPSSKDSPKKFQINQEITVNVSDKSRSVTPGSSGDKKLVNTSGGSSGLAKYSAAEYSASTSARTANYPSSPERDPSRITPISPERRGYGATAV